MMYSRLLQPNKAAVFYASPEGETYDPFYGPIPRGVGGADLDGIPDSPINNKTPEYAEESRGYKNPLAEKGTENKDEDANLAEGIPPGLIVAKVAYREKGKKEEEVPKEEIKYSLGWWQLSSGFVNTTGFNGNLIQCIQWSSQTDHQFEGYSILAFPNEGGEVLRFRGYPFSSFHGIGQDIPTKMGIRFEMGNKGPFPSFSLNDLIPKTKTSSVDIDTDEEVYSVFRSLHSDRRIKNPWHCLAITGLNGTLKQIFQSKEFGDVLLFPREGGKVLRIRHLNIYGGDNHIEDTGDSVSLKDGIRLEVGNHDRSSDERDNRGFQTGGLLTNFVKPISMTKASSVDIHETPTKLPPRNDLRRHIDEDALDEEEKPEMRRLISCLVVAEKEI